MVPEEPQATDCIQFINGIRIAVDPSIAARVQNWTIDMHRSGTKLIFRMPLE
jgi:Fe-S cluster assembly iron-binding protein IscA